MNLNKTCALENLAQLIICVRELMHHSSKVFLNSLIVARPAEAWPGQELVTKPPSIQICVRLTIPQIAPSSFI